MKGTVCGYNALGKDSCQVSSSALCHLCIFVVTSKGFSSTSSRACITCQPLTSLFVQIKGIQWVKLPRFFQAGLTPSFSGEACCGLRGGGWGLGGGKEGGSGRKY